MHRITGLDINLIKVDLMFPVETFWMDFLLLKNINYAQ